jgi:hypothetical protein
MAGIQSMRRMATFNSGVKRMSTLKDKSSNDDSGQSDLSET